MRHVQLVHENPDVYLVHVPFANVITTETNCYVVRDGDDALVVDTGAPSPFSERLLREALGELGVDASRARYFLTHAHYDHAGLVPRLAGPGAVVYLSERELESVTADFARRSARHVRQRFLEEGVPARIAHPDNERISVSVSFDSCAFRLQTVGEGDEVCVGAQSFRVVAVPGHTRGHLALFHPASGICFTGDHVLFLLSPSIPLYLDDTSSLGAYFDSLDKVAKLGCSRLLISHGELRDGFEERIGQLKAHHLRREDAIAGIVEAAAREEAAALEGRGAGAGGVASAGGVAAAGGLRGITGREVIRRVAWKVPFADIDDCDPLQRWTIYAQGTVLLDHMVLAGRVRRVRERLAPPGAHAARVTCAACAAGVEGSSGAAQPDAAAPDEPDGADGSCAVRPAYVNRYLPAG